MGLKLKCPSLARLEQGSKYRQNQVNVPNRACAQSLLVRHAGLDPASRDPRKHWIPAGVYPDENRGRNDTALLKP